MQDSPNIRPRFGRGSIFLLGLTLIAAIILSLIYWRRFGSIIILSESQTLIQFRFLMWLMGMIYGLGAGLCWLVTLIKSRFQRWAARALTVIVLATAQHQLGTEDWLFYLSGLGGLVCCQCMLFHWVGVPNWIGEDDQPVANQTMRQDQFGIGDIVIATTCIAILLAIVIRFQTPIDPLGYWMILAMFWLAGPLVTACAALSLLRPRGISIGLLVLSVLIAGGGVAALTAAEWVLADANQAMASPEMVAINASLYGRIMIAYLGTFVLFCIAGKSTLVVSSETTAELDI